MSLIITIISLLVAVEFLYIMYLETFATTSPKTADTFNMSETDLQSKKYKLC